MGRFLGRILLPQGYPHTVAPNYLQYTRMRGLQYFFGGAIGVFSTRSLLSALGVTGRSKGRYAFLQSPAFPLVLRLDGMGLCVSRA